MSRRLLRDVAALPGAPPLAFTLGRAHGREKAAAGDHEAEFWRRWSRLDRRKLVRWTR